MEVENQEDQGPLWAVVSLIMVMSCTPDILKYASNLKHAIVKLQAIHTKIKYTTRYSQLGKTTGTKNQKNKVW
jgi:hypothetical protein